MIATVTVNPSLDEWVMLRRFRAGELNRATGFQRYPGGKGINVSRVVRMLGGSTMAFALAGGDDGAILKKLLHGLAVPYTCVETSGATRNNYKMVTERPRVVTEVNTPGVRVSLSRLRRLERMVLRARPRPRCVALCGSLPPGVAPATYSRWIRALRRRHILTVLDTSGEALRVGLAAQPWLVKPNRHEAEALVGRRLTSRRALVTALQELLGRGAQHVVLSLGSHGALLASAEPRGVWLASPPRVKVDSAVGAGDSLVGGFLVGWVRGRSLLEAFRLGVACGTACALTPGTELCRRRDVYRILPDVAVRQLV